MKLLTFLLLVAPYVVANVEDGMTVPQDELNVVNEVLDSVEDEEYRSLVRTGYKKE